MTTPQLSYAICCTPRSGSWLLSEGLASTGVAGNPREWFNKQEENRVRVLAGSAPGSRESYLVYLQHAYQLGTTSNGVWGIKMHYDQFECLPNRFVNDDFLRGLPASSLLPRLIPNLRYIWLTRKDKERQSLSHHRALQTDEWWKMDGIEPPRQWGMTTLPKLNLEIVAHLEALLVRFDEEWTRYFKSIDTMPLVITYEDLATDYSGAIRSALKWLAIRGSDSIQLPPPRLLKQADLQTEAWLREYQCCKASTVISSPKEFDETWREWLITSIRRSSPMESMMTTMLTNGFGKAFAHRAITETSRDVGVPIEDP